MATPAMAHAAIDADGNVYAVMATEDIYTDDKFFAGLPAERREKVVKEHRREVAKFYSAALRKGDIATLLPNEEACTRLMAYLDKKHPPQSVPAPL